jgi:hypothetical protein
MAIAAGTLDAPTGLKTVVQIHVGERVGLLPDRRRHPASVWTDRPACSEASFRHQSLLA